MIVMVKKTTTFDWLMFYWPDSAFRNTWHGKCDIEGELALPSENTHHTKGLHLAPGSIDGGTPKICQLAEHNAVFVWNRTAGTPFWGRFISFKVEMKSKEKGRNFDFLILNSHSYRRKHIQLLQMSWHFASNVPDFVVIFWTSLKQRFCRFSESLLKFFIWTSAAFSFICPVRIPNLNVHFHNLFKHIL